MDNETIFDNNKETNRDGSKSLSMTYGLLTALCMIVYSLILYFTGVSITSWLNYMVLAILLIGVILFCLAFSRSREGMVTYGKIFGAGFRMVAFTTIIMIAWALLSLVLLPEMKEHVLEAQQEQMAKSGISAQKIESTMAMMKSKYALFAVVGVMFSNVLYGTIFTLIGALIAPKNKNPDPFK